MTIHPDGYDRLLRKLREDAQSRDGRSWGRGISQSGASVHVPQLTNINKAAVQRAMSGCVSLDANMIEDEQQNKKIFMAPQLICSMNFRELNTEKDDYKKMLLKIRAILRKQIVASLNDEHIASKYIVIFDQLCCGTSLTEIAKRLHISKTRVSVLVEKLRRYPILRTLYSRLRVLASDI